jgi:hypothetical protein
MLKPKRLISENLFQRGLRVVKRTIDGKREYVLGTGTGHLPLLQWRNSPVRIKDENRGPWFA